MLFVQNFVGLIVNHIHIQHGNEKPILKPNTCLGRHCKDFFFFVKLGNFFRQILFLPFVLLTLMEKEHDRTDDEQRRERSKYDTQSHDK